MLPPRFEGLLFTVFREAEIRAGTVEFDTRLLMLLEAERRLAYADENFRAAYIEAANERSKG